MRKTYYTTDKKRRAEQLRADSFQLSQAGFKDSAQQNYEMANYLDPPQLEERDYDNDVSAAHSERTARSSGRGYNAKAALERGAQLPAVQNAIPRTERVGANRRRAA